MEYWVKPFVAAVALTTSEEPKSAGVLIAIPVQTTWIETHYPLPIYWEIVKCARN